MLRRISTNSDRGIRRSISGVILPGCASLVVPLLVATALELPAAAIDRIAAPLLGRGDLVASLQRPVAAQGASSGTHGSFVRVGGSAAAAGHAGVGRLSVSPATATSTRPGAPVIAADGPPSSRTDEWSTSPFPLPVLDEPGSNGSDAGDPGTEGPATAGEGQGLGVGAGGAMTAGSDGAGSDEGASADVQTTGPEGDTADTADDSGPPRTDGGSGSGGTDTSSGASEVPPDGPSLDAPTAPDASSEDVGSGGGFSSTDDSGASGSAPGNSGSAPGHSGDSEPGNSGNAPGHSSDDASPGNSGNAPGHSDDGSPGNSGNTPGHDDDSPGNSSNAYGHVKE